MYTAPEILGLEQSGLFARTWLCVGREADIPGNGDFFTRDIAGDSVIVIRGADARVRAFFNVCRHRGSRLIDVASGQGLNRILCPYHSWSYRLDGGVAQIPGSTGNRDDLGLVPVNLGTHEGFIFLNLDSHAAPLALQLEDLPNLTRFHLPELRCGWRQTYEVRGQLEADLRELQRVLPLPGGAPAARAPQSTSSAAAAGRWKSASASMAGPCS